MRVLVLGSRGLVFERREERERERERERGWLKKRGDGTNGGCQRILSLQLLKRTTQAGRRPRRRECRRRSRPGRRCRLPRASRGRSSCLLGDDGRRRRLLAAAGTKNRLASPGILLLLLLLRANRLDGLHCYRAKKKKIDRLLLPDVAAEAEAEAAEAGAAAAAAAAAFLEPDLVPGRRFDGERSVRACPSCPGSCFGPGTGACSRCARGCGRGCGRGCAPGEESASASDVLLLLVVVRRRSFSFPFFLFWCEEASFFSFSFFVQFHHKNYSLARAESLKWRRGAVPVG